MAESAARIFATGIYIGGSRPLDIGGRYIIVVDVQALEIRGPVDVGPVKVVGSWALSMIEISGLSDRLAISSRAGSANEFAMMFRGLSGATPEAIELAALQARSSGPSQETIDG